MPRSIEDVFLDCHRDYCRREAAKLLAKADLLDQQARLARRRGLLKANRQTKVLMVFAKAKRHGVDFDPKLLAKIRSI